MKTPLLLEHVFLCFPSKALINQQGKVKDIGVDLLERARILKGKSHLQTKDTATEFQQDVQLELETVVT